MIIYIRRVYGSLWELVIDNREDDVEYRTSVEQDNIDAEQRLWEERIRLEGRRHGTTQK